MKLENLKRTGKITKKEIGKGEMKERERKRDCKGEIEEGERGCDRDIVKGEMRDR